MRASDCLKWRAIDEEGGGACWMVSCDAERVGDLSMEQPALMVKYVARNKGSAEGNVTYQMMFFYLSFLWQHC